MLNSIVYDNFGGIYSESAPGTDERFRFEGMELDRAAGSIYWSQTRTYSVALDRWMQQDPIGVQGGDLNLYRYSGNDPINYSDSSGLQDQPTNVTGGVNPTAGGNAGTPTSTSLPSPFSNPPPRGVNIPFTGTGGPSVDPIPLAGTGDPGIGGLVYTPPPSEGNGGMYQGGPFAPSPNPGLPTAPPPKLQYGGNPDYNSMSGGGGAPGASSGPSLLGDALLMLQHPAESFLGFQLGIKQGEVNSLNGLQDAVIGIANGAADLYNGTAGQLGAPKLGHLESPDWSRGMFVAEDDATHANSKFFGGQGAFILLTLGAAEEPMVANALGALSKIPGVCPALRMLGAGASGYGLGNSIDQFGAAAAAGDGWGMAQAGFNGQHSGIGLTRSLI
ncbi:MAG: hypothetical protein KGM43_05715, partial [Planctomycetota bacterium]|nr:hypothetical protein [Planctomycetota bacterium]